MNDLFSKLTNSSNKEYSLLDDERKLEKGDKLQNFELCVQYIITQGADLAKLLVDKRSLNAFKFIQFNSHVNNQFIEVFVRFEKIIESFQKIVHHYTNVFKENSLSVCSKLDLTVFSHTVTILLNSSNESKLFRNKFHEYDGTKVLLSFTNDDDLMEKCQSLKRKDVNINGREPSILRAIVATLFNLSFVAESRTFDFDNMNATAIIINFLNNKSIDDDFRICSYLILANILSNKEIETLPHSKVAINGIIQLVKTAARSIGTRVLKRIQIQTEINGEDLNAADLCVIESTWYNWHIGEVLHGLYRMSVNDKIKSEIFDSIKDDARIIILNGTDHEKVFTLQLLCQLCFDEKNCKKLKEDKQLFSFIQRNAEGVESKIKNIKYLAKCILRSMDKLKSGDEMSRQNSSSSKNMVDDEKKKHIMISYNRETRETCLKMKEKLVQNGFKVWIDVEQIQGSSLDSMAKAIENSFCVLICMTEKYKQSVFCRAEAEYTFIRNVPFVPLILQEGFSADGWLGIMVGSKIYVSFPKLGFNESIEKILFQINSFLKKDTNEPQANMIISTNIKSNKTGELSIKNWTQLEVQEWLAKIEANRDICDTLRMFNGEMLIQLSRVKKTAPDFYFSQISRNNTVELYYVLKFTKDFENLLENL